MKVLIIEDNKELASNIKDYLVREGYVCETSYTYFNAENKLISFHYDCIILDLMLPDGHGINLVRFIKTEKNQSSILILSAKNSLEDKITGLDIGADDYLTKPFHLPELHSRLKALFRRKNLKNDNLVEFQEIGVNVESREARVNQHLLTLTKKEFDLLLFFLINKNRILTRQTIAEHLWGDYTDNLANFDFVYQHVKNLRKKISKAKGNDYITAVYGLGYKFNPNL
ncbi:MAG: response regulator transcription factor [Maribacter sp.]|nr:response regulator transcription factor [Maribacter sp.]